MEILGIGPGEFILILIVLLVVVGPERLPGVARSIGQFLVRARNWLQTSPDAALVMRARAELEAELASIKNSLLEVQVVRDEVLGAARQLEESVGSIAPPKLDLNSLVNPPAEPTTATNGQTSLAGEAPVAGLPDAAESGRMEGSATSTPLDQLTTLDRATSSGLPQRSAETQPYNGMNGLAHSPPEPAAAMPTAPTLAELESINIRLQAIMADMWALQQQLKERGALDKAWQPPSLDVQLPTPDAVAPAEPQPEPAAEPAEDEAVLAARQRLEELTPMQVSYHAPPLIEPTPAEGTPEATTPSQVDTLTNTAAPEAPAEQPAPKPRRRRAAAAEQATTEAAETPANGVPATSARRRRAAATAEPADESAEAPANDAPIAKTRKRRARAADPAIPFAPAVPAVRQAHEPLVEGQGGRRDTAERSDETESITTEKAS